jgi:ribonuclease HII
MPVIPDFNFEKSLLPNDCRYLLGVDEVGRGPWAGPLTLTGFLIDLQTFFPADFIKLSVRDSKKLSHLQRLKIVSAVELKKYSYHTINIQSQDIDQQGITASLQSGLTQILKFYRGLFDICLYDGNNNFGFQKVISVVSGDAKCFSIAAASIVAKESRDAIMDEFDIKYPQYGFIHHKGYGTAAHLAALKLHGPCASHRFSYKPIRQFLSVRI